MNIKKRKELAQLILNSNVNMRTALRQNISQIDAIENLDSLKDLNLTGVQMKDYEFYIYYEGIASQDLYPHVKSKLVKKGIVGLNNILTNPDVKDSKENLTSEVNLKYNKRKSNEYESVRLLVSGASIQITLKVYNPNYKK